MNMKLVCVVVVIFACGISLLNGAEIKDWTFKYEGEKLPNKVGFALNGKPVIAKINKSGVFHLSSIDSNAGVFYYRYMRKQDNRLINSDTGYTLELRAKVIKTDSDENSAAIHIDAEDGREDVKKFWGLNLYRGRDSSYALLSGATSATPVAIGDDFHIYRITVKGDQVNLYIDGTFACGVKVSTKTSTNQLRFGDLTGKADGEWEIDYLRVYTKGAVAPSK